MPSRASPEEIGELARTLNRMLGALEDSRERERRFLADASHELRTPLTALIGNVEYLARHGADREVIADLPPMPSGCGACSTTCSPWSARTAPRLPVNP